MDEQLMKLLKYLPARVRVATEKFLSELTVRDRLLSEIRLRADAPMSLTYSGRNVVSFRGTAIVSTESEIAETLQKLCEDSVHTYSDTLREGYLTLEHGFRVGVCGRVSAEGSRIKNVYAPCALSIRIPHSVRDICGPLLPNLVEQGEVQSALLYSVPNVGKTTLIRDLAATLSRGRNPRRIAIVDTRGEIYRKDMFGESIADVLRGYPRAAGIEIATRTLSPEVIFCDEIGSAEEAQAILSASNSGVPLIATAHASSMEVLMRRPNMRILMENGVFRYYIGLSRSADADAFAFDIHDTKREEAIPC